MAKLTSPRVMVTFRSMGSSAIRRGEKGTVALIVRDAAEQAPFAITKETQIPAGLDKGNQDYIKRAFTGYVNPPKKVIVYVMPPAAQTPAKAKSAGPAESGIGAALKYMSNQVLDYLCGPADCTAEEADAIAAWVKLMRGALGAKYKAVLPNCAANHCAIVNFTGSGMTDGTTTWTTAAYCSRIAGLLAGTPFTISATYAPLPELSGCDKLSQDERDEAVGKGELTLRWDGRKATLDRAVTSYAPANDDGTELQEDLKKIKIVEVMDLIQSDITTTGEDTYIGKFANSYDNKMLLVAAVRGYFLELVKSGLVQAGYEVDLDLERIEEYLCDKSIDTQDMTEQQIREANTGSSVFLVIKCKILDAIEDIHITVYL